VFGGGGRLPPLSSLEVKNMPTDSSMLEENIKEDIIRPLK
jgi:hypothetical protein